MTTLRSWNDTPARRAIVDFVEKVTRQAGGDSKGDIPMLHYAGSKGEPGLRLLLHDDPEREFGYTAGAEKSLERAGHNGWTVVSIKNDWSTVFADSG